MTGARFTRRYAVRGALLLTILWLGCAVAGNKASAGVAVPRTPVAALVSGLAPSAAVQLEPNSRIQVVVNAYPDGTAFLLTTGLYGGFTVIPKSNDRFYAQPGVILDGGDRLDSAFRGPPRGAVDGVELIGASRTDRLVIQHYGTKSHSQIAAVQTSSQGSSGPVYGTGWRLQWVEVAHNLARGVSLSNQMLVVACEISSNGRLGIGGGGTGVTMADNVVDGNGVGVSHKGWEAGGIKTVAHNVLIDGNTISGNGAPGIWTDSGATNVAITQNHLSSNWFGMQIEISRNVSITANEISASQQQAILVVASDSVHISSNSVSDNHQGIIVGGSTRAGPMGIRLDDIEVSHNTLDDTGGNGLHQPVLSGTKISFDWDRYIGSHVQWNGTPVTFARLQGMGQELHGTFET